MAKQTFTTGQVLTAAQQNSLQSNDFNQTVSVKTANYSLLAADKGTRIEFNTSGSVTCTVNSGQFDAGDTLVIQNRGAGTATITAGTATVNTSASLALAQYSAGTLYFVSDSAALFFGDAAGISASLIDAKGDLIVGTADNTVGRLAVGTNGYTLVADSGETTGLKWAAPSTPALVGVSLEKSNATTSLTSNVTSYLTYTTENWDTNTFHDNSTNTTRITIPSGYGGKYLISGYIGFGGVGSDVFEISLRKNGGNAFPGGQFLLMPNNAANTAAGSFATVLSLVATDYLELGMRTTNTNANYAVNSLFQATYLGA